MTKHLWRSELDDQFDHIVFIHLGCSDTNVACACDSRLCPVGPSPPIDDNTCRCDNAHTLPSLVSMAWATKTNYAYIGISADELTFPPALAVSPHSLRLCHPSSFSCVCGRLSRRTTVLFPTPIITHNSGGVAAAIAVAPPDGTNNRSMVVTGNVPKFV